jgi:hypothetical protein
MSEKSFTNMLQMNKAKWKCSVCKSRPVVAGDDLWPRLESYLKEKLDPIADFIKGDLASDLLTIKEKILQFDDIKNSIQFLSEEYDRVNKQLNMNKEDMKVTYEGGQQAAPGEEWSSGTPT